MDIHNILQNREIYGHYKWSRDRYPRYWGVDTYRLGGLECFVDRLEQSASLSCHRGCVNTVRWNANGSKIVSGSDDCHLGIWKINFQFGGESKLLSRFETGHDSNIFHALFIPNTDDNEIVSCALDCDIRYNIIDQNVSKRIGTHDGACHKLDIINKNVFISCSEDGTIKLIDMRDKSTVNQTRATNTVHNTIVQLYKFTHVTDSTAAQQQITTLPKLGKEKVSCYTMTLNPLNNHILAVGCRDKWVRLYDRRTLSVGNGKNAKPYMLLTQHSLSHKQQGSRYGDSEGVTGLAWSYDGQEIAASYSAKNIALFNLYAEKTCLHFTNCNDIAVKHAKTQEETRDLLNSFPNAQSSSSDLDVDVDVVVDVKEDIKDDNAMDDDSKSETRSRSISPSPQHKHGRNSEEEDAEVASFINDEDEDMDHDKIARSPTNHSNNRVKKAVSKVKGLMTGIKEKAKSKNHNFKKKFERRKKRFHLFSKSSKYYHQSYESGYIPYSLQIANYTGHRTVETVKECNFFGPKSEYVISGSDCKHVFIWRKSDQKIVNILAGDARIANVVQGNPTNCSLVTSGLDSTVKLFTPTSTVEYKQNEREKREKEWEQLLQENERDSERSRRPIPMSLLVYLLRRGLYGFDTDDDEEEEDEEKDEVDDDDEKDSDSDDDDDDEQEEEEEEEDEEDEDGDIGDEDAAVLSFIAN